MKGRPVPPRPQPFEADERRVQACLAACAHLSTEALESGLVHDALEALGLLQTGMALAADIASRGANPADYFDFARLVRQIAPIAARVEASGFNEAANRAWEARTGQPLADVPDTVLLPLKARRRS